MASSLSERTLWWETPVVLWAVPTTLGEHKPLALANEHALHRPTRGIS